MKPPYHNFTERNGSVDFSRMWHNRLSNTWATEIDHVLFSWVVQLIGSFNSIRLFDLISFCCPCLFVTMLILIRWAIFLLRGRERVAAATSNYRQKTCLHLHLYLNHIVSGTGRARTEPARQHVSLDDLNGFPSVTKKKKRPFSISLAFSFTARRYNRFFFSFSPFSLRPCTRSRLVVWVEWASESESASERENRQRLFYYSYLPCLCMYCVRLTQFECRGIVCMYACFSKGWSTDSIMKNSCFSTSTSDYINS